MRARRTTNGISFECPGCKDTHVIPTEGNGTTWSWNGSLDKPTITPSLKVTSGHYTSQWKEGDSCWCTYNKEHPERPSTFTCFCCHSVITDGRIVFCADSTHELAGKEIDLPDRY